MKTLKDKSAKQNKKQNEKLTQNELRELMGMNQATYRRHKGAIRRK